MLEADALVIGSGIAGGIAALQLARQGAQVILVNRTREPTDSNTYYAQGGIIYRGEEDSPRLLVQDIVRAGAGLTRRKTARILAEEGPRLVEQILIRDLQVPLDRLPDGRLALSREGGHSIPRIIHSSDTTGKAIETALIQRLESLENVTFLKGYTAVDLLTPSHHSRNRLAVYEPETCVGAYLFDQKKRRVIRCVAKKTILATGGLGQIFLRTTNPPGARGDGLAMAYRAGARVINTEFIQFHPTALYQEKAPLFLISEAVRGAGARLVDANGQPFMEKYDPLWKDLAPRDVVARGILQEMLEQEIPHVYLDLKSYLPAEEIKQRFPNIYQYCYSQGIDITRELVPVVPAAHYSIGGVWTDEWGRTSIRNLYAIGEVACTGLHGANRLASTSLLEGLVWGNRAARHILNQLPRVAMPDARHLPPWIDTGTEDPDPALIQQDMNVIKHIMWNYVGLVRTTRRLDRAMRELRHLEMEIEHFYRISRLTDSLIGLRNAVQAAILVATAAWKNKQSMGCHYRE
ncbi:MAG: L-aspartate oxidase [Calditrichaeota bacterium]|nr:L-aspartate oxidase [Calditrichota bacterium]